MTRELDSRTADGILVILLWDPAEDGLKVSVDDSRTGESFEIDVRRENALDAFNHPFSYA